jgi:hypothetical protein
MKIEDHPKPFANDHPYKSQLGIAKLEKELSPATQINRPKLAPNDHADQRQCKITKLEKELETSNKTVKKLNRKLSKLDLRKNLDREMGIMEDYFEYINSDTESQLDHVEKIRQAAFKARKESSINTSEVVLNFEMVCDARTSRKRNVADTSIASNLRVHLRQLDAVGLWHEAQKFNAGPSLPPLAGSVQKSGRCWSASAHLERSATSHCQTRDFATRCSRYGNYVGRPPENLGSASAE